MLLAIEKSSSDDASLAWGLYKDFIIENIHKKHGIATPLSEWITNEESAFRTLWRGDECYTILVDSEPVGWLSTETAGDTVTIENVFIVEHWQNKGIGEKIIEQITPQLRSEGKAVEIPVLLGTNTAAGIERTLSGLGYRVDRDDGPHRIYSTN